MTDDIVARLRTFTDTLLLGDFQGLAATTASAADEIERLRSVVEAWRVYSSRAERDIAELRAERDGARAEVCLLRTGPTCATDTVNQSMADYAESRGWHDLFREEQ